MALSDPSGAIEGRPNKLRAAQYLRMSTDMQRYSIDNQARAIADYASQRGITIVDTYVDAGRSGLSLANREGLKRLLADIKTGTVPFCMVLVYDVSRWGRFQDADESGFYEFQCHQAGIRVEYCAEAFENDGSSLTTLMKTMKRVMAAEYSRDLSRRVFFGQCNSAQLGFWPSSKAPYGLRRQLVSQDGKSKGILQRGDRKNLIQDRVVLVHGPAEEVNIIRRCFSLYANKISPRGIAELFNSEGKVAWDGEPWKRDRISRLLINEAYAGVINFNKTNRKMQGVRTYNPKERWIRAENAIEPIVTRELFDKVQALRQRRLYGWPEEALIEGLQRLHRDHGTISADLIDASPDLPLARTLYFRGGGVRGACQSAGFYFPRSNAYVPINRQLRKLRLSVAKEIVEAFAGHGDLAKVIRKGQGIVSSTGWTAHITIGRYSDTSGSLPAKWLFNLSQKHSDLYVGIRMKPENAEIDCFYVFPAIMGDRKIARIAEGRPDPYAAYRVPDLTELAQAVHRASARQALTSWL